MNLFDKGYKTGTTEMLSFLQGFVKGCLQMTFADENQRLQWILEEIEQKLKEIEEQ